MIKDFFLQTLFLQAQAPTIGMAWLVALVPLLPLLAFLLLVFFGKRFFKKQAGIIATFFLLTATVLAVYIAYYYFTHNYFGYYLKPIAFKIQWLAFTDALTIDMGALLDPISMLMIVIVTFVSLMVHIYSLAYMKGEERFAMYYAYLGLFTFSMLGLVLSSNIFQMYIFWELVGLSSFLLIGFYYKKPSAVAASKKAFIVTRFADVFFLIGILIVSNHAGSMDFNTIVASLTSTNSPQITSALSASFLGVSALTWGMTLIFIGGAGKSAMFPLHIWLPDAMEGPTPVSALIHAATMVVAGVFLVARLFPVYALSVPSTLHVIAYVGAFSALFAAVIACTQTDIKRVLAYSTMSQIGFMLFALGVSKYEGESGLGFTASMFHLFTHALFKALLFLCAGAVIHYVHSNDMKDMGGLRKHLPITHFCFLIACLAIAGVPPLSGFFSKEGILLAAYQNNSIVFWVALFTSGLTAFYMFRLYFSIFWNKQAAHHTQHGEGGAAIVLPLLLLCAGTIVAGFVPFGNLVSADGVKQASHFHLQFAMAPVAVGLAGIILALWLYKKQNDKPANIVNSIKAIYKAAYHKFYIDELYLFITHKIITNGIAKPAAWIDKNIVDGMINATGSLTQKISEQIKNIQSGKVQQYAIYFLAGTVLLAALFMYIWK
jgi:NADH-quinone oxidoreductase subunit L